MSDDILIVKLQKTPGDACCGSESQQSTDGRWIGNR